MRLTAQERLQIAQATALVLPTGSRVCLFGSRTDDQRRGGDIDLLVETPSALDAPRQVALRTRFAAELYRRLGERRIDLLFVAESEPCGAAADGSLELDGKAEDRLIVREARRQAIELARA